MIRQYPPWCKHMLGYFKACWAFFTPCLLLVSTKHPPGAGGRGEKSSPPSISPSPLRRAALGLERGCLVLLPPPRACLWLLEVAQGSPEGPCVSQPGQDPGARQCHGVTLLVPALPFSSCSSAPAWTCTICPCTTAPTSTPPGAQTSASVWASSPACRSRSGPSWPCAASRGH